MLAAAALSLLICLTATATEQSVVPPYADMAVAREWCDSQQLHRIEGIWEFPEDGVKVIIMAAGNAAGCDYEMRVIGAVGTTLRPGDIIGRLSRTSHPDKFRLEMRRTAKLTLSRKWIPCAATLAASDAALDVASQNRKLTFNPLGLLPYFWRVARLRASDPAASLPHGLVRLYPSYDGNGSSLFNPRYL